MKRRQRRVPALADRELHALARGGTAANKKRLIEVEQTTTAQEIVRELRALADRLELLFDRDQNHGDT